MNKAIDILFHFQCCFFFPVSVLHETDLDHRLSSIDDDTMTKRSLKAPNAWSAPSSVRWVAGLNSPISLSTSHPTGSFPS